MDMIFKSIDVIHNALVIFFIVFFIPIAIYVIHKVINIMGISKDLKNLFNKVFWGKIKKLDNPSIKNKVILTSTFIILFIIGCSVCFLHVTLIAKCLIYIILISVFLKISILVREI